MSDIAPELLEKLVKSYKEKVAKDPELNRIKKKINNGTARSIDSERFSVRSGELLTEAFQEHVSADILPDRTMYYNIAQRVIDSLAKQNFENAADAAEEIIKIQNAAISETLAQVQTLKATVNQDRVDGLVNLACSDQYDQVEDRLKAGLINLSQAAHTETVRRNAEMNSKMGFKPKIIRTAAKGCCKWCTNLAGTYDYTPDMDRDVFRKHANCECTVEYIPDQSGRVQDVWSKEWKDSNPKGRELEKEIDKAAEAKASKVSTMPEHLDKYRIKDDVERRKLIDRCLKSNDAIYVNPTDRLAINAKRIKPVDGYYDVVCHGAINYVKIFDSDTDVETLCASIAQRPDYKKRQPIRLLSCETGKSDNGVAAYIAKKLKTTVIAPLEKLFVYPSGSLEIGTALRRKDGCIKKFVYNDVTGKVDIEVL